MIRAQGDLLEPEHNVEAISAVFQFFRVKPSSRPPCLESIYRRHCAWISGSRVSAKNPPPSNVCVLWPPVCARAGDGFCEDNDPAVPTEVCGKRVAEQITGRGLSKLRWAS